MQRLVVVIMGQNCEKFLPMCLESVKQADSIVYCDGGSKDKTLMKVNDFLGNQISNNLMSNIVAIENNYDQEDAQMNGKQRNFYLNYVKENYPDYWCLALDADEVVEDLDAIKKYIQVAVGGVNSVKMRHFHTDLGHEDSTQKEHFVLNRLFKISEADSYPEVEHPVLKAKDEKNQFLFRGTTIWHLAHIQHCFEIKKRYEKNIKHSNIHSKEFLDKWYLAHLLGQYPNTQINAVDIPEVILKHFGIDKDMFYFANRGVETKHFLMTGQWADKFKPQKVIEFGCGLAPFGVGFNHLGFDYKGIELSKFAVEHAFVPITQGDITNYANDKQYDLCLVFDVLEHLSKYDLEVALENIKNKADNFIFSVPTLGDPNLEADKTHKIKESKEWWLIMLSKYVNIEKTPKDWLFANQIIVGSRK